MYILLTRPGVLTKEYFAEHRARFLPPVRVYLVLSVVFFALGSFEPQTNTGAAPAATDIADEDHGSNTGLFLGDRQCIGLHSDIPWLDDSLRASCARHGNDGGAHLKQALVHNIPKMMFVFVPLVALTMLLLYWRPRHLYVEHLVFFLHNHAAMFLLLVLEIPVAKIARVTGHKTIAGWVISVTSGYAVWYVYRAMRVYYGQGRFRTIAKLLVVGFAYLMALAVTLLTTLVLSAVVT